MNSFNFGAGPGMLPAPVKDRIKEEIDDWHLGMSVMEVSHRSKEFIELAEKSTEKLRKLLSIPKDYEILFLNSGARAQFSMVPMNLLGDGDAADYLISGLWSQWAYDDASKLRKVNIVGSSFDYGYLDLPKQYKTNHNSMYLHYTDNETIHGVEFKSPPKTDLPLVSDMTSSLLSKPIDVSKHAAIYASCQKNMGISGLTVVILDPKMLKVSADTQPLIMQYQPYIKNNSMFNTPCMFTWYVLDLVLDWLIDLGSIDFIHKQNQEQANSLYNYIDSSKLYGNAVEPSCRSSMNITFGFADNKLETDFLAKASDNGFHQLKGHRSIGGCRASLYNSMPNEGVESLISFMKKYEEENFL